METGRSHLVLSETSGVWIDVSDDFRILASGDRFLWFVPVFMLAIIIFGVARLIWEKMPAVFALTGVVGGGLSAYLMIHERALTNERAADVDTSLSRRVADRVREQILQDLANARRVCLHLR